MLRRFLTKRSVIYGATCFVVLGSIFWISGALWPEVVPAFATSRRQVIGMSLMLILMPPYLVTAGMEIQERSARLIDELRGDLPSAAAADEAQASIRNALRHSWPFGLASGIAMGLFNAPVEYALFESTTKSIDIVTAFGQIFMWLLVGLFMGQRFITARSFSRLGEIIDFDLFRLDTLRPLARSGLNDVFLIVTLFAFSPLQSLDAEFRWYNYAFAIVVAVPTAIFLLFWPLRALHQRIVGKRDQQIERVSERIDVANRDGAEDDVVHLEMLLSHRDRLEEQSTWPLRATLVSRSIVYLIIPPLAWVGAALVENLVTDVLSN